MHDTEPARTIVETPDATKDRILTAAEQFCRVMRTPRDPERKLSEWRAEQNAALAALMDAVGHQEALDACDS
jgi:hypothetical protein